MKLTKLMHILLTVIVGLSTVESYAINHSPTKKTTTQAVKKTQKTEKAKQTQKTAAKTTKTTKQTTKTAKKNTSPQNESKSLYGVKGAKLQPTKVHNQRYTYREKGKKHTTISKEASRLYSQTGIASYYGGKFHGRKTASGEIYNQNAYTAAHKTLALGSYALVTNLRNGRKVIVRINDRGPFSQSRIIDLSVAAAREIGMVYTGISQVRVEAMQVDKNGYITGKGAESLRKLAQKEGLPFAVKGKGDQLAIKASPNAKKSTPIVNQEKQTTQSSKGKKTTHTTVKDKGSTKETITTKVDKKPTLTVIVNNIQEAKKLAKTVKQKTQTKKVGNHYEVTINVASQSESQRVKKQIAKVIQYQKINYSIK